MLAGVFERLTELARQVVVLAQQDAVTLRHNHIGIEHILLGVLAEREGLGARALRSAGVTLDHARGEVRRSSAWAPRRSTDRCRLPTAPSERSNCLWTKHSVSDTTTSAPSTFTRPNPPR